LLFAQEAVEEKDEKELCKFIVLTKLSIANTLHKSTRFKVTLFKEIAMTILYKTDISSEANLKVFITDIQSEADIIVFESQDRWAATEPQVWFTTDISSEAEKIVFYTSSKWEADLVAYRTDIQSEAGWQNSAKAGLL
jgi:hypothetical protein